MIIIIIQHFCQFFKLEARDPQGTKRVIIANTMSRRNYINYIFSSSFKNRVCVGLDTVSPCAHGEHSLDHDWGRRGFDPAVLGLGLAVASSSFPVRTYRADCDRTPTCLLAKYYYTECWTSYYYDYSCRALKALS